MRWGIEGIVGESFAEIFADNCKSLGIPTVTLGADEVDRIQTRTEEEPETPLEIDVEKERVTVGEREYDANVSDAQKEALVEGIWDTTALMRTSLDRAKGTYDDLPYTDW
jgi:3-isopropylmalate/(R)-2-methylmalate dehydratase small subunit